MRLPGMGVEREAPVADLLDGEDTVMAREARDGDGHKHRPPYYMGRGKGYCQDYCKLVMSQASCGVIPG